MAPENSIVNLNSQVYKSRYKYWDTTNLKIITPGTQYGNLSGVLNNGIINKNSSGSLEDLNDILLNNLEKDDILIYNGMNWINKNFKDVTKKYIWEFNGGNAEGWKEDEEENPDVPETNNFAEEFLINLYNFINSEDFQNIVEGDKIKGVTGIYMEQNKVTININGRIKELIDYFYKDKEISSMLGNIITSIYENVARNNIRDTMEEFGDDLEDRVFEWQVDGENEKEINERLFIYFSDSSGAFIDVVIEYKKR